MPTTTTVTQPLSGWTDAMQKWWADTEAQFEPMWRAWWGVLSPQQQSAMPWADPLRGRHAPRHRHGACGCDRCSCCIPDADITLHARAGERRVIAFELRNERRRDREVTLEIGRWTPCEGPDLNVAADFDVASPLTLAACENRIVRLRLAIADKADERGANDVDSCATAVTDVRFEGCSRPVRVAVVVHPAECDAYDV
ncbi:MAG: hypothetical protein JWO57_2800, partial [Pseudonocardiales bacterium]|nr:hypothetical protein [Pseudonocardiales bacterium]